MKLVAKKSQLKVAPAIWLRSAGYQYIEDRLSGHESFVRRLTRDFYPRFHIYFTAMTGSDGVEVITFDLHLDQKRPGYAGQSRHNAEYDGEVVTQEIARLKSILVPNFFN